MNDVLLMHGVKTKQHMIDVVLAKLFSVGCGFLKLLLNDLFLGTPVHVVDKHPDSIAVLVQLVTSDQVIAGNESHQASFIDDSLAGYLSFLLIRMLKINLLQCIVDPSVPVLAKVYLSRYSLSKYAFRLVSSTWVLTADLDCFKDLS